MELPMSNYEGACRLCHGGGRRSPALGQESHLSEPVTSSKLVDRLTVLLDPNSARNYDEHLRAKLALPHEDLARLDVDLVSELAQALQVGLPEACEQGDRVEQVELRIG